MARWASDIDAHQFLTPVIPSGWAAPLALAAEEHQLALAPASPAQTTNRLMEMRLSTQRRNETDMEAEHSFRVLVRELADVPDDIVAEACRRYIRAERFFPRSPSELLAYTGPLLAERRRRYRNLIAMAQAAREQEEREREINAEREPASLEDLRALLAFPSVSASILETYLAKGWARPEDVQTIRDEIAARGPAVPQD